MAAPTAGPVWLTKARELVGLKEIVGSRHEAKVLQFFAEAGHPEIHNDETAWCAAFANAMLRRAGYAGTGSLAARSFLTWGDKLKEPALGCIVVFKRGNSAWQGHVAFFLRDLGNRVEVLGGNQGNAVSIATMPKADVLGYRWPSIKSAPAAANKPKTPAVEKTATAGKVASGAVVAGTVAKGVEQGWSPTTWLVAFSILGAAAVVAYFGWRWWQGRPQEDAISAPIVSRRLAGGHQGLSTEPAPANPPSGGSSGKPAIVVREIGPAIWTYEAKVVTTPRKRPAKAKTTRKTTRKKKAA